jgi:hypothetical protein
MLEIIFVIVFVIGIIGMALIIWKKVPALMELVPQEEGPSIFNKIKNKFKIKFSPKDIFLHKLLLKIRILILKTDNKTSEWVKVLREKTVKNKEKFSEDYWQKLKK